MPATPDERERLELMAEIEPGDIGDPLDTTAQPIDDEGLIGPGFMRRALAGFVKLRDAVNQLGAAVGQLQGKVGQIQVNVAAQRAALELESAARAALEPRIAALEDATAQDRATDDARLDSLEERVHQPPPAEPIP